MHEVTQALAALLADPALAELNRTFTVWIISLLRRKAGALSIADIDSINDLRGVHTMLAERIDAWFEEARHKGIQQGLLQGEAKIIARLLERRFGPLPPEVMERLSGAQEAQLVAWGEAVLSAPSLEAVFGSAAH